MEPTIASFMRGMEAHNADAEVQAIEVVQDDHGRPIYEVRVRGFNLPFRFRSAEHCLRVLDRIKFGKTELGEGRRLGEAALDLAFLRSVDQADGLPQ